MTIASGGVLPKIHPEILRRKHDRKFGIAPESPEIKSRPSAPAKSRKKSAVIKKFTATGKTAARGPSKVNMIKWYTLIK